MNPLKEYYPEGGSGRLYLEFHGGVRKIFLTLVDRFLLKNRK